MNSPVVTAIHVLSMACTTATHAQKHIFGERERESSGESANFFFSCPARYIRIAQDRGVVDSRQCMQLIPLE
jgi:hypothetical protein